MSVKDQIYSTHEGQDDVESQWLSYVGTEGCLMSPCIACPFQADCDSQVEKQICGSAESLDEAIDSGDEPDEELESRAGESEYEMLLAIGFQPNVQGVL